MSELNITEDTVNNGLLLEDEVKIEGDEVIPQNIGVGEEEFDLEFTFLDQDGNHHDLFERIGEEERESPLRILIRMENNEDEQQTFREPIYPPPGEIIEVLKRGVNETTDFDCKSQFISEMEQGICEVINECVHVLHKDPREYHPFYLRTHKYITLGVEKGHFGDDVEVNSVWEKWNNYAVTQFEERKEKEGKFDGPRSSYLRYILEKKVYYGERLIEIPRNEYQRRKRFRELEEIRRNIMKKTKGQRIREDLKVRREFFEHCKTMTFPGDVVRINLLWAKLLKSDDEVLGEVEDKVLDKKVYLTWKEEKDEAYSTKCRWMSTARKRVDNAKKRHRQTQLTEEEIQERRREDKRRYANMTEEKKNAYTARKREARTKLRTRKRDPEAAQGRKERTEARKKKIRYADMTEDERKEMRMRKYMYYVAYQSKLTKEDRAKQNKAKREKIKATLTEEKKQAMTEWQRNWRHNLSGEKKDRYVASVRRAVKKNWEKTKKDPEKHGKVKERMNERSRIAVANETPEQREKRLQRMRRYTARKKLKKLYPYMSEDEIEKNVLEVLATQAVKKSIGSYKPRPQARKPRKPFSSTNKNCKEAEVAPFIALQPSSLLPPTTADVSESCTPIFLAPPPSPTHTQNVIVCQYTLPNLSGGEATTTQFSLQLHPPIRHEENPFTQIVSSSSKETVTTSIFIPVTTTNNAEQQFIEINQLSSCVPEATCHVSVSVEDTLHEPHHDYDDHFTSCELEPEPPATQPAAAARALSLSEPQPPLQFSEILLPIPTPSAIVGLKEEQPAVATEKEASKSKPKYTRSKKKDAMCEECGGVYTSGYIHMHKELHDPTTKVKCPQCPSVFRRGRNLWHHFSRLHLEQDVDIELDDSFSNANQSRKTKPKPTQESPCTYCSVCDQQFDSDSNLRRHYHFIHGEGSVPSNYMICPFCPKKFKQKCTLDDHIRRLHEKVADYRCDICARDLQSAGKLWKHKVDIHSMSDLPPPPDLEVITCEYCNEKILRGYEIHVKKRHPDKLTVFQRKIADLVVPKPKVPVTYNDDDACISIPNSSHTSSLINCPECNKKILHSSLKRHLRNVHQRGKIKAFKCDHCEKVFKERYHLSEHVRVVHLPSSKPDLLDPTTTTALSDKKLAKTQVVTCSLCPRKMVLSSLERHVQKMHPNGEEGEQRRFPCPKCGKEFKEKYHLREHIVDIHEDIDEKIRAKKLFKRIIDTESSSLRRLFFKCILCGEKCKGKHQMRAHLATNHSLLYDNLRKWNSLISLNCKECSQPETFGSEEEIRSHLENVHPEKCSRCPECDKVFLEKDATTELQDHIRLEHNEDDGNDELELEKIKRLKTKITTEPKNDNESETERSKRKRNPTTGFKYNCMRCEQGKYNVLEELSDHVREEHPQNFWPCKYCGLMKYTERGLLFHSQMCTKRPRNEKETRKRQPAKVMRREQQDKTVSFDRMPAFCEICKKMICLYSLMRHYEYVHGVKEEQSWRCHLCDKEFKRREYWITHMDVQHAGVVDIDELVKEAMKMNVKDKSNLMIVNPGGKVRSAKKGKVRKGGGARKRKATGGGTSIRMKRSSKIRLEQEKVHVPEQSDSRFTKQLTICVIRLTDEEICQYKKQKLSI